MARNVVVLLNNSDGQKMVKKACKDSGFIFAEFEELVEAEVTQMGKQRRAGLWDAFDDILDRIKIEE
jgi:hypothetical protein